MANTSDDTDYQDSYLIFGTNGTIDYRGSWVMDTFTLPGSSGQRISHDTADNNASMTVPFVGSRIQVRGIIPLGEDVIRANYSIDGGIPETRSVAGLSQDDPLFFQILYASPLLENTYHNLTVQMVDIGSGGNYSFQRFRVFTNETSQNQELIDGIAHGNGKTNDAVIVGGVLGSLMLLLLIFQVSFYIRRRGWYQQMLKSSNHQAAHTTPEGTQEREELRNESGAHSQGSVLRRSNLSIPGINPFILPAQETQNSVKEVDTSRPNTIISSTSAPPAYAIIDARSEAIARYGTSHESSHGTRTSMSENPFNDHAKSLTV